MSELLSAIQYQINIKVCKSIGFRTGHSTELAALHLVNDLTKQMDTGKFPQTYVLICLKHLTDLITPYCFTS